MKRATKCLHAGDIQSFQLADHSGNDFLDWCPDCGARRIITGVVWHDDEFITWESPDTKIGRWRKPKGIK